MELKRGIRLMEPQLGRLKPKLTRHMPFPLCFIQGRKALARPSGPLKRAFNVVLKWLQHFSGDIRANQDVRATDEITKHIEHVFRVVMASTFELHP